MDGGTSRVEPGERVIACRWRHMELETSEELVRWIEAEGLSPMTLLDIRLPRGAADAPSGRSRAPKTVKPIKMVWGVQDLESEGERERFLAWPVVAEGVTLLRTEGELDPYEECHVTVLEGSGVAFRLEAGGVVDLHCTRCVIGTPTARARKAKPRPHHGELHLELDVTSITMQQVRSWLGIPTEMPLVDRRGSVASDDVGVLGGRRLTFGPAPERSWLWVASDSASRLSLSRGKWSSDEFWSTVWRRARLVPGVKSISSRDLVTEPAAWPLSRRPSPRPKCGPTYSSSCVTIEPWSARVRELGRALPGGDVGTGPRRADHRPSRRAHAGRLTLWPYRSWRRDLDRRMQRSRARERSHLSA